MDRRIEAGQPVRRGGLPARVEVGVDLCVARDGRVNVVVSKLDVDAVHVDGRLRSVEGVAVADCEILRLARCAGHLDQIARAANAVEPIALYEAPERPALSRSDRPGRGVRGTVGDLGLEVNSLRRPRIDVLDIEPNVVR